MADKDKPETRTRSTQSDKSAQTEQEQSAAEQRKAEAKARAEEKSKAEAELKAKRETEKAERELKRAAEKKEREEKREADKAKKEQEREAAKAEKEQAKIKERQDKIDAGEIIFADYERNLVPASDANGDWSGVTYVLTEPKKEEVANRAREVIQELMETATEVPVSGKDLADRYLGGTVQWVAFFGMLRVLGYVKPYRFRTGERGESGLAYLWVGPSLDLGQVDEIAEAAEPVEEPAAA